MDLIPLDAEEGDLRGEVANVAEVEVDLVSHNGSFTTLDEIWLTISPIPPTQTNESNARFSARRVEWGYGDA